MDRQETVPNVVRRQVTFPTKKQVHIAGATTENEFWDEDGNLHQKVQNHMLCPVKGRKELLVEFGVGTELNSINKKPIPREIKTVCGSKEHERSLGEGTLLQQDNG